MFYKAISKYVYLEVNYILTTYIFYNTIPKHNFSVVFYKMREIRSKVRSVIYWTSLQINIEMIVMFSGKCEYFHLGSGELSVLDNLSK